MHWIVHLSLRYLPLAGKKQSVQWITRIAFFAITIITACSVIIQSVMNGFTHLVVHLYEVLEPDIKIEHLEKKFFQKELFPFFRIQHLTEPGGMFVVMEKKILVKNHDQMQYVNACFVPHGYLQIFHIDTLVVPLNNKNGKKHFFIIGKGLANVLGISEDNLVNDVLVMTPSGHVSEHSAVWQNEEMFHQMHVPVTGIFSLNEELDFSRVFLPLSASSELTGDSMTIRSVHLKIKAQTSADKTAETLRKILGPEWKVTSRMEANYSLVRTLQSEKIVTSILLWFILCIAIFTVIGALTMLILDKKKDIFILYSLGAPLSQIKKIFILDGAMITFVGGGIGLLSGSIICLIQEKFQLVPFGDDFIVKYYPVRTEWNDLLTTFVVVIILSIVAGIYPSRNFISEDKLSYSLHSKN